MNFYKVLFATLVSTGFLLSSSISSAEARRGARANSSNSASVDVNYDFAVYDTDPTENAIGCIAISDGCLFKDAVGDFEITSLRFVDFLSDAINSAEVGTSTSKLYGPEVSPAQDALGFVTDFPLSFSDSLSLKTELVLSGSEIAQYTIADELGEEVLARGTGFTGGGFEDEFTRDFSFSLYSNNATVLPNEGLIDSIEYIVSVLREDVDLPEGYFFANDQADSNFPVDFNAVDTELTTGGPTTKEVPEPAFALGLLSFGLAGAFLKK